VRSIHIITIGQASHNALEVVGNHSPISISASFAVPSHVHCYDRIAAIGQLPRHLIPILPLAAVHV
jgi:hypothetical protein